jgi:hypothetical protein
VRNTIRQSPLFKLRHLQCMLQHEEASMHEFLVGKIMSHEFPTRNGALDDFFAFWFNVV